MPSGDRRVSFVVPPSILDRLDKLPWGTRSMLLRIMTEKLLDAVEGQGQIVIGAILDGKFRLVYEEPESVRNSDSSEGEAA